MASHIPVSIDTTDALRFINVPTALLPSLKATILDWWPKGVDGDSSFEDDLLAVRLLGEPWLAKGNNAVTVPQLLLNLLKTMEQNRWRLVVSTDFSNTMSDRDLWIMKKLKDGAPSVDKLCSISTLSDDTLRIINGTSNFVDTVAAAIEDTWQKGTHDKPMYMSKHCVEIKLKGTPWSYTKPEMMYMLVAILTKLYDLGWALYCCTEIQSSEFQPDTWVFSRRDSDTATKLASTCAIHLVDSDKLRVINNNDVHVIESILGAIAVTWEKGIDKETPMEYDCHEIKMKGEPFGEWSKTEACISGKRMILEVLRSLLCAGWVLQASTNLSVNPKAMDLMWFKSSETTHPPEKVRIIGMMPMGSDKVRLIDGGGDEVKLLRTAIEESWPKGVQQESDKMLTAGYHTFKLKGNPFNGSWGASKESVPARQLVARIFSTFDKAGWRPYGSINCCQASSHYDQDLWVFLQLS
eukprot:GFYU01012159.1.p1 GENE.GFYU01012159.1~~GFYU01012159.1.p1  ORF type:complete len:484 (+),score=70.54 GFYU01012159.1:55-1452(+)